MRTLNVLLITTLAVAQAQTTTARLEDVVNGYVKNRNFIGSVLVAKGGKVILDQGFGMANMELDVPNTPDTKFRLGSITKQFTATAILQLQEQSKLSVSDPACKYVEGCPDAWKQVTIHQLLTHTSGIPSYTNLKEFPTPKFMRQPLSPIEVVMMTKDKPMDFEPGTKYSYDNTGYVMLGVIIEKASGEKYADYLRKHIFEPLDMQDSGYDVTATLLKHRAAGYAPGLGGLRNADYLDMTLPHAAGSLYSTTRDLYRWDRALHGEKVLSAASKKAMWTPDKENYAYGWDVKPLYGHAKTAHGGGINGFSTFILRLPDDDAVVIALSNNQAGNPGALANSLAGILLGEKIELPWERKFVTLDPKVLDRYTGTYKMDPIEVAVTNENGKLMIQPKGQPKQEAKPISENVFFVDRADAKLTFSNGELTLEQGGGSLKGKRIQ